MSETFTIYVAKYVLTKGIFEAEASHYLRIRDKQFKETKGWVTVRASGRHCFTQHFKLGVDAFPTREEALERAEQMRARRIASLKKQIAKLEGMSFS